MVARMDGSTAVSWGGKKAGSWVGWTAWPMVDLKGACSAGSRAVKSVTRMAAMWGLLKAEWKDGCWAARMADSTKGPKWVDHSAGRTESPQAAHWAATKDSPRAGRWDLKKAALMVARMDGSTAVS